MAEEFLVAQKDVGNRDVKTGKVAFLCMLCKGRLTDVSFQTNCVRKGRHRGRGLEANQHGSIEIQKKHRKLSTVPKICLTW